jgi:DNA-binding transcriptional ArsR family regulator
MPLTSSELIGAVSHPLRRRILLAYLGGAVDRASAAELAELLDQRVAQVAYHLKTLARSEILQPVQSGHGPRGGEVHYGWTLAVEPEWLRLLLDVWSDSEVSG